MIVCAILCYSNASALTRTDTVTVVGIKKDSPYEKGTDGKNYAHVETEHDCDVSIRCAAPAKLPSFIQYIFDTGKEAKERKGVQTHLSMEIPADDCYTILKQVLRATKINPVEIDITGDRVTAVRIKL